VRDHDRPAEHEAQPDQARRQINAARASGDEQALSDHTIRPARGTLIPNVISA